MGQLINRRVERFRILQPQHLIHPIDIFFRVAGEYDVIPVGRFVSAALDLGGADATVDNDKILRGIEHTGLVSSVCWRYLFSPNYFLSDKLFVFNERVCYPRQ